MEFPSTFVLYVRPNKRQTKFLGFDPSRKAYVLEVAAVPVDGQANDEIVRFFKKEFGLRVEIISGLSSKNKKIRVI